MIIFMIEMSKGERLQTHAAQKERQKRSKWQKITIVKCNDGGRCF